MVEKLNATAFPRKYSVQFVSPAGRLSQPFYFDQHLDGPASQTWQVTRSEFDHMLADNAREKGAKIIEGAQVLRILYRDGQAIGVEVREPGGTTRHRFSRLVIDASGRNALAMARNRWRKPDPGLKKVAIWTYYEGAMRDPGKDEGATTVAYVHRKAWFWYIPQQEDRVSVGLVGAKDELFAESRDPETAFQLAVKQNTWVADYLAPGRQVQPCQVTSDFSYRSAHCASDGLVLVGDALAFLDPVFSSGVLLALKSGELAADAADAALAAGDVSAMRFRDYGETMRRGIEAMRNLVYAFYDEGFSFRSILQRHPHLQPDLTDCLIGHVDRPFDALFAAMKEVARLPAPLPYGTPHEAARLPVDAGVS
jgi:flavin-dependent dehydrogenase